MEQLVVLRRELADFSVASKAASLTQVFKIYFDFNKQVSVKYIFFKSFCEYQSEFIAYSSLQRGEDFDG